MNPSKEKHARKARATERRRDGPPRIIRRGVRSRRTRDIYHTLLTIPWPEMIALTAGAYLGINLIFAVLYLADPGGIANARPGNLADCYFFSVQTMATIGYGAMYPKSLYANVVVSFETVVGLMSFALITGLWFTRFSRPTARILFSKYAVVAPFEGKRSLMFRMANERTSQILQAEVRVTLLRDETTREGVPLRRMHDLRLLRDHSAFFGLTWTVAHVIDATSPLHGGTPQSWAESGAQIVVLVAGVEETLNQTIHARFSYECAELRWDQRFVDILVEDEQGRQVIDMEHFHDTEPLAVPDEETQAAARRVEG